MSVRKEQYIIVGADIGFKNDDDYHELLEPYMRRNSRRDGHPSGLTCVYDGMSGEYVVVGKLIKYGDEYEGIGIVNLSKQEIGLDTFREVQGLIKQEIGIEVALSDVNVYVIDHYR